MKRFLVGLVLSAIGLTALAGSAHAAPANAPGAVTFSANCGRDGTIEVLVNLSNNGNWSPAFLPETNQVFIPTAFGPFVGTFTAPDGTVFPINEPAATKASPRNEAQIISCSFHLDFFNHGGHIVADGSATGFLTPGHP